jgi:SAM-dependent methyltransferase
VADFIFCEHCVEHVIAADCLRFMDECHRILRPGGVLRLCVPILDNITDTAHARDLVLGHGHCVVFNAGNMFRLLCLAGFKSVIVTGRATCYSHWKVIGMEKDDLETLRVEAAK